MRFLFLFRVVLRFLFVFSFFTCSAQHWLGISSSNYAGTNSQYLNPANIVDSRFKLYVNFAGNGIFLNNNYLSYNAPYSFLSLITNSVSNKYRNEQGLIIWKDSYYSEKLNGQPKDIHIGGDVRGPSFLYSNKTNTTAFGFSSRWRYQLDLTGVSEQTARIIRFGTDPVELQNVPYIDQKAQLSTNGFLEMAATFGAVLKDDEEDFWKAGISVKRLVGMFNTHADLQSADYTNLPLPSPPNREILFARRLQAVYGYTTEEATKFKITPSWLFGGASAGSGWGVDIGVAYEYRPDIQKLKLSNPKGGGRYNDPKKNKYKFRISAALNDVGFIRYKNPNLVREFDIDRTNVTFSYVQFDKQGSAVGATNAVNRTLNLQPNDNFRAFTVMLPTTMNLSFDYYYKKNWYINALWIQGLRGNGYLNISPQSVLAITPRYEKKWVEVAIPIGLLDNYSTLSLGLSARVGPVIVGTDHLGGLLNIGRPHGLDFYFALYAPFFQAKPKDPNRCFYPPYEKPSKRK